MILYNILTAILLHGLCVEALSDELLNVTTPELLTNLTKLFPYNLPEDGLLDFNGLALKYVFPAKEYDVVTEDGYLLKVFRLENVEGPVVLLSHGLISSSDDFLIRGHTSLIYLLVKQGYDVWAMNYRGNRYSRRHIKYDPDIDPLYWDFCMHEFGFYDLPAVIDFILEKTERKSLSIVGHSEGSAAVFILLSQKEEYNDKINQLITAAPACYISNGGIALKVLLELGPPIIHIFKVMGINEFVGYDSLSRKLWSFLCSQGTVGYYVCYEGVIGIIDGYDPDNIEPEFFLSTLGHFSAGTSRKNIEHYLQIGNSGRFANYDYGLLNLLHYGLEMPPLYDLGKVKCPVTLIAAKNDHLVSIKDIKRLQSELHDGVLYYEVEYDKFTHMDYIWGRYAHEVVYPYIINQLNSTRNNMK